MKRLSFLVRQPEPPFPEDAPGWIARARSGTMSRASVEALEHWLTSDEQNRRDYDALNARLVDLDRLRSHPEIMALREEARQSPKSRRYVAVAAAFALLLTGTAATLAFLGLNAFDSAQEASVVTAYYETPEGRASAVTLPDGSKVYLDASSAVKASMSDTVRDVQLLRGRANFSVVKDKDRPFVVLAGGQTIKALGTQFDVNLAEHSTELTLMEGTVLVRARKNGAEAASTIFMRPGYKFVASDGNWTLSPVNLQDSSRWRDGILVFDEARLGDIVAEMNRYLATKIVISAPALAEQRMSAVLKAGDVATFLSAIDAIGVAHWGRIPNDGYELREVGRKKI